MPPFVPKMLVSLCKRNYASENPDLDAWLSDVCMLVSMTNGDLEELITESGFGEQELIASIHFFSVTGAFDILQKLISSYLEENASDENAVFALASILIGAHKATYSVENKTRLAKALGTSVTNEVGEGLWAKVEKRLLKDKMLPLELYND
ncbi:MULTISPECIES: hypothetical protein [unclassified Roseovarius]|uniref:hypothetical protein n=1 Tax=unclassified Roseovarius TaxID=2614913 RepID=UPI00273D81A0|nr:MULTISPECIES: hypothetical protein [unclassified Roseovarius]